MAIQQTNCTYKSRPEFCHYNIDGIRIVTSAELFPPPRMAYAHSLDFGVSSNNTLEFFNSIRAADFDADFAFVGACKRRRVKNGEVKKTE